MPDRRTSGLPPYTDPVDTDPGFEPGRPEPADTDPSLRPVEAPPTVVANGPATRPAPVRTTLHPGVVLDGRYQLQRHISARGEVQLWQGEDQVLARPVAIRLLIDTGTPEATDGIQHLLDAARRSGQLIHTGAASTYDATTTSADGLLLAYVVSEWVHGISLLDLLRDGPLLPDRAATVLLSVARVVAAAHAVAVTHGDLHPGDVIITSHGLVKVLDLEMRAALGDRAPSQQRARDVTGLGALLYASLTGRWPLGAGRGLPPAEVDSTGTCLSPRQLRAGVPRDLDALTLAALGAAAGPEVASGPQPSAAEMVTALERIVAELPTGGQPSIDGPEADTPAANAANAAQAERLARALALRQRTLRRRVLPIVLLVVLALGAWIIGVAVGRIPNHDGKAPPPSGGVSAKPSAAKLALAAVNDFDPLGDQVEDPTSVPLSHDNNVTTAWATEMYCGSQWGGNPNKTGVGLKVDLGRPIAVSQVRLLFQQPGVSVELRYGDTDSPSLDAYNTVAATSPASRLAGQILTPNAGAHRYWLIWLTSLPRQMKTNGAACLGNATPYLANLAEMAFYG